MYENSLMDKPENDVFQGWRQQILSVTKPNNPEARLSQIDEAEKKYVIEFAKMARFGINLSIANDRYKTFVEYLNDAYPHMNFLKRNLIT